MKITRHISLLATIVLLGGGSYGHVDNPLLPEGCGSCHVGHGVSGEPMMEASQERACYQCHGSDQQRSVMVSAGRLAPSAEPMDIEQEFKKIYRHPVEEEFEHSPTERLPSATSFSISHAECVDCHNPHQRITGAGNQVKNVTGFSLSGQYLDRSIREYEICLKCHIGSPGTPSLQKNLQRQFSLSVRSQHPVTQPTVGGKSVSLVSSLSSGSEMKCTDCHTNDNANGPKGPHGSKYEFLLSGNYATNVYSEESPFAYEFCYSCHDRSSILGNESFPLHREHIEGNPLRNIKGTSCFTCHASHSSQSYDHLIDFNLLAVSSESTTHRLIYISSGERSGECYLSCHGHNHSPARY